MSRSWTMLQNFYFKMSDKPMKMANSAKIALFVPYKLKLIKNVFFCKSNLNGQLFSILLHLKKYYFKINFVLFFQ